MSASQLQPTATPPDDGPALTLEQARCVIWQTQPKQPMGQLLDSGVIGRKDLVWASQKAYRPEVRQAARTLLQAINAPSVAPAAERVLLAAVSAEPSRYGPRVVVASAYLEERQENSFGLVMFGVGMGFIAFVYLVWFLIQSIWLEPFWPATLASVSLALSAAILIPYVRKQLRAWRTARQGRRGEEQVLDALRESLDQRWTIYRNLQLLDRTADLDLVLVGPGGVWCVQVKAYRAPLRYHAGRWETRHGQSWRPCDATFDPERAVTAQALRLHSFLAREGIERYVERAIALAEGIPAANVAESPLPVWLPFSVRQQTASLVTRYPVSDDERARINAILAQRADAQRAVEHDRRTGGRA